MLCSNQFKTSIVVQKFVFSKAEASPSSADVLPFTAGRKIAKYKTRNTPKDRLRSFCNELSSDIENAVKAFGEDVRGAERGKTLAINDYLPRQFFITKLLTAKFPSVAGVTVHQFVSFEPSSPTTTAPGLVVDTAVDPGTDVVWLPDSCLITASMAKAIFSHLSLSRTDSLALLLFTVYWLEFERRGQTGNVHHKATTSSHYIRNRELLLSFVSTLPAATEANVCGALLPVTRTIDDSGETISDVYVGYEGYLPADFRRNLDEQHDRFETFLKRINRLKMQRGLTLADRSFQLLVLAWAFTQVNSRAFEYLNDTVLAPVLDLINHHCTEANVSLKEKSTGKSGLGLVAHKKIKPNQEVSKVK